MSSGSSVWLTEPSPKGIRLLKYRCTQNENQNDIGKSDIGEKDNITNENGHNEHVRNFSSTDENIVQVLAYFQYVTS